MAKLQPAPFDPAAHARKLARAPGASWRFQTHDSVKARSLPGARKLKDRFDEVVVDDWLHAEMMDTRSCFVTVAGLALWLHLTPAGAVVTHAELRDEGPAGDALLELLCGMRPTEAERKNSEKSHAHDQLKKRRVSEKKTPKAAKKSRVQREAF